MGKIAVTVKKCEAHTIEFLRQLISIRDRVLGLSAICFFARVTLRHLSIILILKTAVYP